MRRGLLFLSMCLLVGLLYIVDIYWRHTQTHRVQTLRASLPPPQKIEIPKDPVATWDDVFDLAGLYHYGSYPHYSPRPELAVPLYRKIMSECPYPSYRQLASLRLVQCSTRPMHAEDVRGDTLPAAPPPIIRIEATTAQEEDGRPCILNDRQNAHDHGVTSSIKSRLHALETDPTLKHIQGRTAIEAVLSDTLLDMGDEERAKAWTVLESLGHTTPHSQFGMTEEQALDLVVSKITSMDDEELKRNALETVCKQLASGFEHGSTVCTTGKIARIVSALDGVDTTTIKPVWAVKEELGSLAASIRDDVMKAAAPEEGDLEDVMKTRFRETAHRIYCKELGMKQEIVEPLIDELSLGF